MAELTPWQRFTLERLGPTYHYDPETGWMTRTLPSGGTYRYRTPLRGPRYSDVRVPAGHVVTGGTASKEQKLREAYPEFVAWLEAHGLTVEDHYRATGGA